MVGFLAGDAKIGACGLPLGAVRVDAAAAAPLVRDEVGELVFEGAPEFVGFALIELGIELDGTIRPPRAAGGGLHP